jgi:hypothetical protein
LHQNHRNSIAAIAGFSSMLISMERNLSPSGMTWRRWAASSANIRRSKSTGPKRSVLRRERASETVVSLRQNGVGPEKNCADAILPKGHIELISIKVEFGRLITAQRNRRNF